MIDKIKALELREQGKSYKEISEELCCSVDWCKKNLKGIKKKDLLPEDLEYLREKGKSAVCVTTGEIYSKLIPSPEYDKKQMKLALRRTKDKLKEDQDVIIRQAWIHPERARFSYDNMISYIDMLNDVITEYVTLHLIECGFTKEEMRKDSLYNATMVFMLKNSQFGSLTGGYQQGVFEAINASIERIEERNQQLQHVMLPADCTDTTPPY